MREARPIATQNPSVGLLPLCHCLPRSPRTRCPAAAALCQRLASRHTPFRGFQNMREARPITTQNPSVGLYRFATAFPDHREHVALQRLPFASALALPRGNNPFPSLQVHSIASALPSHRPVSLLGLVLPCVSEAPLGSLPCYPPFSFTGPSRWCAMLDVDSSSSPVPAPGHVAILHLRVGKRWWSLRPALPWVMLRIYQPSAREQGDDTYRWLLWWVTQNPGENHGQTWQIWKHVG